MIKDLFEKIILKKKGWKIIWRLSSFISNELKLKSFYLDLSPFSWDYALFL